MITPEIKDLVLNTLCDTVDFERLEILSKSDILKISELKFDELQAIFRQFERLGLISDLNIRRNSDNLHIVVRLDALDFRNNGGFTVQEQLLELTLEKLSLEVEQLRNEYPDKAERFTTIAANIATCLSFLIATK